MGRGSKGGFCHEKKGAGRRRRLMVGKDPAEKGMLLAGGSTEESGNGEVV